MGVLYLPLFFRITSLAIPLAQCQWNILKIWVKSTVTKANNKIQQRANFEQCILLDLILKYIHDQGPMSLRVYEPIIEILPKLCIAPAWNIMNVSGHYFAYVPSAQLLGYVQNCDPNLSIIFHIKTPGILNYVPLNSLWHYSQIYHFKDIAIIWESATV